MSKKIRVRFAPSPTGPLHIGGVRTALFNYLFAKQNKGTFILRIEDTDQKRYVEGAEKYIRESLEWCGLSPDESPDKSGDFAPYRQSERREIYAGYAQKLIESGNAYYAFDTPEELDALRKKLEAAKSSVRHYNAHTRGEMKNSFTLPEEQVKKRIENGEPYVIRFAMPENETVVMQDLIRGEIKVNSSELDDKVLFKSDGLPTYHLANVVDDRLMEISHVIRGEEWLPSLPLHVLLYKAIGEEKNMPEFAHLPLILKPNGKGKLSKRDGEKLGFPVFPLEWKSPEDGSISAGYREDGYLPEAFINMLVFLGWNPGSDQEIFSKEELISAFDLEKIGKGGAKFSPEKARWFNQQYILKHSNKELSEHIAPFLKSKKIEYSNDYLQKVISLVKERMNLLSDFWEQAGFFFEAPMEYNPKVVKKKWKKDSPELLKSIRDILRNIDVSNFSSENTEEKVKSFITENELGFGKVLNPLRLVLTGSGGGPHLFDILSVLGKEESLNRIDSGLENLPQK